MIKNKIIVLATTLLAILVSCAKVMVITNPIQIESPSPKEAITKVSLTTQQQGYVQNGNAFAFNCMAELYKSIGNTMVFSPLSLQYALAMAVNGASGETAEEITSMLGYGTDVEALNEYCNLLLNQLPAVDLDVKLKLADAMIVNERFPVMDSYKKLLADTYYAPVEYVSMKDKEAVVARINDWASRNTSGLINNLLKNDDINDDFVAAILNALYFKAKWSGSKADPMFLSEMTLKNQPFYYDGGGQGKADLMSTTRYLRYTRQDGYEAVMIPYSNGNYAMYVLLPDEKGGNGLDKLVSALPEISWPEVESSMTSEAEVHLRLPKFEAESRFELPDVLNALGMRKAFVEKEAEFDRMFDVPDEWYFWIGKVIQKACIKVSEWGTEAAAVTAELMSGATDGPKPEEVFFYADHPFVYLISERTSGVILFEGVYTG